MLLYVEWDDACSGRLGRWQIDFRIVYLYLSSSSSGHLLNYGKFTLNERA